MGICNINLTHKNSYEIAQGIFTEKSNAMSHSNQTAQYYKEMQTYKSINIIQI